MAKKFMTGLVGMMPGASRTPKPGHREVAVYLYFSGKGVRDYHHGVWREKFSCQRPTVMKVDARGHPVSSNPGYTYIGSMYVDNHPFLVTDETLYAALAAGMALVWAGYHLVRHRARKRVY